MALAQLNVTLGLQIQSFQRSLNRLERDINRFQRRFETIGTNLTQSISLPLAALAGSAVTAFGEFESLERAFQAVAAEGTNVGEEIERLRKIAQAPGLGFSQAVQASTRLQAVGLSAGQAARVVEQFGNAVARSGGGAESLDGAVLALTQIASKGKISAEEINQLSERIFEIRPALKAAFGTADSEALQKLGISAEEFIARTTEELAKLDRVNGGLANSFENFRDSARQALTDIGREIAKTIDLPAILDRISAALEKAATFFRNLSPEAKRTAINIGLVAIAIGPVLLIVAKLASVFSLATAGAKILISGVKSLASAVVFLVSPVGLVVAGIVALTAAAIYLYNKFELVRKIANGLIEGFKALGDLAKTVAGNIAQGFIDLFQGNFKSALSSFKDAFTQGSLISVGKEFAQGFGDGFEDGSNRINATIDGIKAKIKQLSSPGTTAPGAGGAGTTAFDLGGFERAEGKAAGKALDPALSKAQLLKDIFDAALLRFTASIKTVSSGRVGLLDLGLSTPIINEQKEALLAYDRSLKLINDTATVFATNPLQETFAATESALKAAVAQFGITSDAVRLLKAEYDALKVAVDQANEEQKLTIELQNVFRSAFEAGANAVANAGRGVVDALRAVGRAALQSAADVFKAKIIEGVASVIADSLKKFGLVGLAIAAGAGAAAGGIFQAALSRITAPKLAKGGLAFGPTLAVVGDNPAARTDPEVIAPLSRLKDILGGSMGGGFVAEARISGTDLALLVSRANLRNERIR